MKTLAFLFFVSLIVLLAGLVLNEGHTQPSPAEPIPSSLDGSANLKKNLASPRLTPIARLSPKSQARVEPTPLILAMEADNFCEANQIVVQKGAYDKSDVPALMASLGASPVLQKIFGINGPIFGAASQTISPSEEKAVRFLLAARLGQLTWIGLSGEADYDRAISLLSDLEKEDSSNAAYPFFRLAILKKKKAPTQKLVEAAEAAASGSEFNTHIVDLLKELEPQRWQSPSHHLTMTSFFRGFQNPFNLYEGTQALKEAEKEGAAGVVERVGRLLIQKGKSAYRSSYFLEYSDGEFDVGRDLLGNVDPSSYELDAQKEGGRNLPIFPYMGTTECAREKYEAPFQEMRSFL